MEELLASPLRTVGVLTAPQLAGAPRGGKLLQFLAEHAIPTTPVSESEFRSAAETESPQGVLAVAEIPQRSLEDLVTRDGFRMLLLDGLQDPGNVGTILRTAAAFSFDATVALPGTVDIWNPKVVRGAMGSLFHHAAFHDTAERLLPFLKSHGVELWGADARGEALPDGPFPLRLAVAVGNEGSGLSSYVRERVSRLVSIPLAAAVESINVAVATGILLHHLRN